MIQPQILSSYPLSHHYTPFLYVDVYQNLNHVFNSCKYVCVSMHVYMYVYMYCNLRTQLYIILLNKDGNTGILSVPFELSFIYQLLFYASRHKMTTEKDSGVISGVQDEEGGPIKWSKELPETCALSK